jgi:predicted regulator of Ras-like GTPase activity (Roadblock/LC7/MglB family)
MELLSLIGKVDVYVPFNSLLTNMVKEVPGASGAILADWEGEAVAQYYLDSDDYELKVTGAHKGIILNHMKEVHAQLGGGDLRVATITSSTQHVLIGAIGPDYVLVMMLERNAILALAEQRFRICQAALYKEICE